ncbi:IclR family transcriptional regulator [Lacisediminimonas profundi]|uniref:IclR family transcriptional regulator n=1 Tax=Lacisediminimonas profundi TaxID=2603856 RepID=UPI00124B3FEB|nr:IclR family transcriptional regulator [Lacisediminimonas profundi]
MSKTNAPEKPVGALVSGLAVLRYLASTRTPAGVTRIARDLELNSSTCFNLLKTLAHEGLINFDDPTKTYTIGLGLVELAKGALEQSSYVRMVHPFLEQIAANHRVTATLWHRTHGDRVVLLDRADHEAAIRVHMSIGQRLPMYIAALGRCMAAYSRLEPEQLRLHFENLRWESGPTFDEYLLEIEEVRKRGYAVDSGSYVKGVTTVSAAVLDESERPVMAISAVGFSGQLDKTAIKALGEALKESADKVSRALAGHVRARP